MDKESEIMLEAADSMVDGKNLLQCKYCGAKFDTIDELDDHECEDDYFPCEACGDEFDTQNDLDAHECEYDEEDDEEDDED